MPNTVEFPDCCGFLIINKFRGGHPGANPEDCCSEDDCDKYLQRQEKEYFNKRAGLLAVLSAPQNELLGEVFLNRKWVILLNGKMNPRTGVKVWMYYRDLNYTAARERRIFGK